MTGLRRHWLQWRTWCVLISLASVLAVYNLKSRFGVLLEPGVDLQPASQERGYGFGWPFSFLRVAQFHSSYYSIWWHSGSRRPWWIWEDRRAGRHLVTPRSYFSRNLLDFNLLVALVLLVCTGYWIEHWFRRHPEALRPKWPKSFQFRLRTLLLLPVAVAMLFGLSTADRYFPYRQLEYIAVMASPFIAMALVCMARWIRRQPRPLRSTLQVGLLLLSVGTCMLTVATPGLGQYITMKEACLWLLSALLGAGVFCTVCTVTTLAASLYRRFRPRPDAK